MPFGRYVGVDIVDLPTEYLEWLLTLELREPLLSAVKAEEALRRAPMDSVRQMAEELVTAGYRVMALRHHPDRGGSTETMRAVNQAATWLRGQVGRLTS